MTTATVAESDGLLIEQAVAEYEALRAGGLGSLLSEIETLGGKVEMCGSKADPGHRTICYVPDGADAVLPLAVGEEEVCLARFKVIDRSGRPYWDPRSHPPLVAIVDGARRPFRPTRGRFVVGVVEAPGRVLLLAAVGESLAVIHLAGKARTVVHSGRPLTFSEVDVDRTIRWRRSREVDHRPAPRVRPPAKVRGYHLRIVGAVEVDVGDGPSIDAVLSRGLRALEWRARTVKLAGRRRRGKTKLRLVLDVFYRVLRAGGGIFEGGPADVMAEIKARCPDFDLDVETFSNVLGLLLAAGTCLVQRPALREWRLCLSPELLDPRSDLHRRFCEETVGLVRKLVAGEVLTGASEDAANGPSPAASPRGKRSTRAGGPSATTSEPGTAADAASTNNATTSASPATAEPADAPKQPTGPAQDARVDTPSASSNDAATSRDPGQGAASGFATAAASTPTELDLDYVCSNPKLAAESLFALVTKIGSRIADEPDPLARRSYELTFTSAMFKCFIRQGITPATGAERGRRLSTTLLAGPAAQPETSSSAKQPGADSEEVVSEQVDHSTAAADVDRHDGGMNEGTSERPAPEVPSAAAVPAEAEGPAIDTAERGAAASDHDGADSASAADRGEAAALLNVEAKLTADAVEREPADTAEAVERREAGMNERTAEEPAAASVAHDEAKSIDTAEHMEVSAGAEAVGRLLADITAASETDDTADRAEIGADSTAAPELDDTTGHTEVGADAGVVGRHLADSTAAPELGATAEHTEVGADAGAVGWILADITIAPELDDTAEGAEIGAGAGDEELADLADEAAHGGVIMYKKTAEGERLNTGERELGELSTAEAAPSVATIDTERPDLWSNTGLLAAVATRCGEPPDLQAPRRRPLFAPGNCIALLTQGWTAPLIRAPPVPLMRFAVPIPICEPCSINDDTCTVSISTAGPELTQAPRGPLQA